MRVAVASLRFAPGHIAHLKAYKELFRTLGCEVRLFLNSGYSCFVQTSSDVVFQSTADDLLEWNPDMVLSYNISKENICLARKCKLRNIHFYYVLHEPWDSLKNLAIAGKRIPRKIVSNVVNYLTAYYAHKVILASETGLDKFRRYMKTCNKNYAVFPLIFCDDFDVSANIERKYFSYIGGFTESRACSAFLDYVVYSTKKKKDTRFCIATRDKIDSYLNESYIQQAIKAGTLVVFSGKPMSTEEINNHYRESICSWNAYRISTQSGVLPNALMQGSPVLVTNRGDSRNIVREKREGCFIRLPYTNDEIENAFDYINEHIKEMSEAARKAFQENYNYRVYADKAREVYEIE